MKTRETFGSVVRLWWRGKKRLGQSWDVMKREKRLGQSWDCDEDGKMFGSLVRLWWRGKKRLGHSWDCDEEGRNVWVICETVMKREKTTVGSVVRLWSYHEDQRNVWVGRYAVQLSRRRREYWHCLSTLVTWVHHEDRKNVWVTLMLQRERLREPNNVSESPRILNDDLDLSWRQRKHLGQPWRRALIMETDDRNIWVSQKTWRGKMTQMKNQGHHDDMHLSWRQTIKTSGLLGRRGLTIKTEEISGSPCKH